MKIEAVTIDAYGTLLTLRDPVPALQAALARRAIERSAADVQRAFEADSWRRDHQFRARCIAQLQEAMQRHVETLREILIAEVGCPRFMTHALQLEVPITDLADWVGFATNYEFERNLPAPATMVPPAPALCSSTTG